MARNVFHQPLDRVVGVGAFVNVLRAAFDRVMRPHVLKFAFRHPAPSDVLVDDNVTLFGKQGRGTNVLTVPVYAVGRHTVGCAAQENRVGNGTVLGNVNGSEESNPIPHRDGVLVLGVVLLDTFQSLWKGRRGNHKKKQSQPNSLPGQMIPHRFLPRSRSSECTLSLVFLVWPPLRTGQSGGSGEQSSSTRARLEIKINAT